MTITCESCGERFQGKGRARFCSSGCRQRAYRERRDGARALAAAPAIAAPSPDAVSDYARALAAAKARVIGAGLDLVEREELGVAYAHAAARLCALERLHADLGSPFLDAGPGGRRIAHPLLAELDRAERSLCRLDAALTARAAPAGQGNRFGQHVAPDRRAKITPLRRQS